MRTQTSTALRATLDDCHGSRERAQLKAKLARAEKRERHAAEVALYSARWLRKARGRISLKDARHLGELQTDLAYRWGFWGQDRLETRRPGWLAAWYAEAKDHASPARVARELADLRTHMTHTCFWYGPTGGQAGIWPGDRLVFDRTIPPAFDKGTPGAWVVQRGNG